jgi:hypothetical protein
MRRLLADRLVAITGAAVLLMSALFAILRAR